MRTAVFQAKKKFLLHTFKNSIISAKCQYLCKLLTKFNSFCLLFFYGNKFKLLEKIIK